MRTERFAGGKSRRNCGFGFGDVRLVLGALGFVSEFAEPCVWMVGLEMQCGIVTVLLEPELRWPMMIFDTWMV